MAITTAGVKPARGRVVMNAFADQGIEVTLTASAEKKVAGRSGTKAAVKAPVKKAAAPAKKAAPAK
ncbi:MAG: RNA polymerase sigma factor, partial [Tetrasphaera sp.]|nr:RNA polymerase sigma factor [Tetrasphaera sp.]